jgi:hypothetical protein
MNSFLSVIWARRLVALLLGLIFLAPTTSTFARGGGKGGPVSVNGYFRSNGTYVAPHMRSAPDGNFSNNWSAVGNINPYTGEEGKKTTPANIGDSRTGGPIGPSPVGLSPADNPSNDQITSVPPSVEGLPTASQGLPNNQTNISPPNQLKTYTTSLSPNAELDYTGRSWQCRRGYFPRGSECVAVSMPPNAELDYTGRSWQCRRGYFPRGSECLPV